MVEKRPAELQTVGVGANTVMESIALVFLHGSLARKLQWELGGRGRSKSDPTLATSVVFSSKTSVLVA